MEEETVTFFSAILEMRDAEFPNNVRTFGFKAGHQTHEMIWLCDNALKLAKSRAENLYEIKLSP